MKAVISCITNFKNIILLFIFILLCLIVVSNLDSRINGGYFVLEPNLKISINVPPNTLKGVNGEVNFSSNSHGFRGGEFGNEKIKILTIGTSIFEQGLVDDQNTWQNLLQKELRAKGYDIKIYDALKSGLLSPQRIIEIFNKMAKYKFDLIIIHGTTVYDSEKPTDSFFSRVDLPDWENKNLSITHNALIFKLKAGIKNLLNSLSLEKANIGDRTLEKILKEINNYNFNSLPMLEPEDEKQIVEKYQKGIKELISFLKNNSINTILIPTLHASTCMIETDINQISWRRSYLEINKLKKRISPFQFKRLVNSVNSLFYLQAKQANIPFLEINNCKGLGIDNFWDEHHFNSKGSLSFKELILPLVESKIRNL